MSTPAPPLGALRRAARPAPPLHGPARAFAAEADPDPDPTWNHELPGTGIEVILEFSGGWDLEIDGRGAVVGSFAAGLVAGPVRSRPRGATRLVQLAVDPLAIPAVLGVPAGELRGAAVALDTVLGRDGDRLLELVDGSIEAAETADAWALGRLRAASEPGSAHAATSVPPDVQRAVALLRASGGRLTIEALAVELGCSRRHLARRFNTWLGATPSEYRRLVRFECTTSALRAEPARPLGALALDCGYADHAHMDREFRALAGAPPSVVAARLAAQTATPPPALT